MHEPGRQRLLSDAAKYYSSMICILNTTVVELVCSARELCHVYMVSWIIVSCTTMSVQPLTSYEILKVLAWPQPRMRGAKATHLFEVATHPDRQKATTFCVQQQ